MLTQLTVRGFKSCAEVIVPLGQVNVFIGANGSGKSNLLEALGVLSAAAEGRVYDAPLLQRGVRTGVPKLYKTSFARRSSAAARHLYLGACGDEGEYDVALWNPLDDPSPAWRFKTEAWLDGTGAKLASRSPASAAKHNAEQGLAALRAIEHSEDEPAVRLLRSLQGYAIFAPTTAVLRGTAQELQPLQPVGLSGGGLPRAVDELLQDRSKSGHAAMVAREALSLIDWADSFGSAPAAALALSPMAAASPRVIRFRDRFMSPGRNTLSGYDASEGALYVLFMAVLAAHARSPRLFAVDNADHGLNPRLANRLMGRFCEWVLTAPQPRQVMLTTHNPAVLDGLPLTDDRVRLFTVARAVDGPTVVRRVALNDKLRSMADQGWTLSRLWVMGHLGGVPNV